MAFQLAKRALPRRRISLTPLIDVVFILLVFFMLETTFLREGAVGVAGLEEGSVSTTPVDKLSVELFDADTVWVNGRRFTRDGWPAALDEFAGRGELPVEAEDPVIDKQSAEGFALAYYSFYSETLSDV